MSFPAMVTAALAEMDAPSREHFHTEYDRRKKSAFWGYVLWLCLGWHYAYARKWGIQILFWCTAGGFLVWWFVDLFRVPGIVADYNAEQAVGALRDVKIISGR